MNSVEAEATKFVMPCGKYKGKSLFQIACEDPRYLDWVASWPDDSRTRRAVLLAIKHPDIERRIDAALNQ